MGQGTGFTADEILNMVGKTIKGIRLVNGTSLILTTTSGEFEIDAGNVKGLPLVDPHANTLPSTATGSITSTNTQLALVELAAEIARFTTGTTAKLRRTQVKKIYSGQVTHNGGYYAQDGYVEHGETYFPNEFPAGYFLAAPSVVITPVKSELVNNSILPGWTVSGITTRSFYITAANAYQDGSTGGFPQIRSVPFNYVATSGEFFT